MLVHYKHSPVKGLVMVVDLFNIFILLLFECKKSVLKY